MGFRPQYNNPDPTVCLIGSANKADVLINNVETIALVDTGVQASMISRGFAKQLGLKIRSMKKMIQFEGTGGSQSKTGKVWWEYLNAGCSW